MKSKNKAINYLLFTLCSIIMLHQHQPILGQNFDRFRIMFYNVENLFDTEDDPTINDNEFTSNGQRNWNEYRLRKKWSNIFKVMAAVGQGSLPDMVGFCEVENRYVLEQLLKQTPLRYHGYDIIHKESKDSRGIDVALLYRTDKYWPLEEKFITVRFTNSDRLSRDILYSKGLLPNKDTLHIFINHWPSKFGGAMATRPLRDDVARTLKTVTDSIQKRNPKAAIVITGDFNTSPDDEPIVEILGAVAVNDTADSKLVNLTPSIFPSKYPGTLKFQGIWDCIDQFILTKTMIDKSKGKTKTSEELIYIGYYDFLLEDDETYLGKKPFRTYVGFRFNDGYSDHLPTYLDLILYE